MDALSNALASQGLLTPKASPYEAIRKAADETGVDFNYLWRTAQRESGLDPNARASTSSATGLFQFTDSTWLAMMDRYGDKHGMAATGANGEGLNRDDLLALRTDPELSARMAAELAEENRKILASGIGREPTSQELYAAHFLGPSGAAELIREARADGDRPADSFFERPARANKAIFYDGQGEARSLSAVYARLTGKLISEVEDGAAAVRPATEGPQTPRSDLTDQLAQVRRHGALMAALIDLQSSHNKDPWSDDD